jgi:hypothetical protein
VTITDCTFTSNTARGGDGAGGGQGGEGDGAAVFNLDGSVTLNDDTLAKNSVRGGSGSGSAVFPGTGTVYTLIGGDLIQTGAEPSATLTLNNNILSNTIGPSAGTGDDLVSQGRMGAEVTITGGNNLVQSQHLTDTNIAPGVITQTADPQLGPLQDNGGLTHTLAIQASSPAFGGGNPSASGVPTTDQTGNPRVSPNRRLDLGAFQVQASPPRLPLPPVSPPVTTIPTTIHFSLAGDDFENGFEEVETVSLYVTGQLGFTPTGSVTIIDVDQQQEVPLVNGGNAVARFTFNLFSPQEAAAAHTHNIEALFTDPSGQFAASVGVTAQDSSPPLLDDGAALLGACVAAFFSLL